MVKANYKKKQKQEKKNQKKHEEKAGKSFSEQKVNLAKEEHFFGPIIPDCLKTNFKNKLSARFTLTTCKIDIYSGTIF